MSDQDPVFVKRVFASIAKRYVLTNHVLSMGIDIAWRKRVAQLVAADQPKSILDVATGSGDLAVAVQKACRMQRSLAPIFAPKCWRMLRSEG